MSSQNFELTYESAQIELLSYELSQFHNKTIYLNCESHIYSNLFLRFVHAFDVYSPKKVIMTGKGKNGKGFKAEYRGECGDCHIPIWDEHVYITELEEDGSFDSPECLDILKESDIVIGNPPSKKTFRKYMELIQSENKKFIVSVSLNNLNVREIIEPFKEGKIWAGCTDIRKMEVFDSHKGKKSLTSKVKELVGVHYCWITNLAKEEKTISLELTESFDEEKYQRYDNYDIIDVPRLSDIPKDYDGIMGVPITFLRKHHQSQFEILGTQRTMKDRRVYDLYRGDKESADADIGLSINGETSAARVFIKAK